MNKFILLMWRLGLDSWLNFWPAIGGRIMVVTHFGRKTGLKRRIPVNYALVEGELYCTAGFGHTSDWYRNIKANPQVEVWLPEGWWTGIAEEITAPEWRLPLLRQVLIASGFAAPAVGVYPKTMSDAELASVTTDYRLIHIRRTEARTGSGGPGDLAWVWPFATLTLLPLVLFQRKRKR